MGKPSARSTQPPSRSRSGRSSAASHASVPSATAAVAPDGAAAADGSGAPPGASGATHEPQLTEHFVFHSGRARGPRYTVVTRVTMTREIERDATVCGRTRERGERHEREEMGCVADAPGARARAPESAFA